MIDVKYNTPTAEGQQPMAQSAPVVIASDQSAVPISGAVTTTPPANASTNLTQVGGNPVVTGTGIGGIGIPRVTVSNDSTVTANAGINLNTSALALDATVAKLTIGQSIALGTNTQAMVGGSVTTSAPTYIT